MSRQYGTYHYLQVMLSATESEPLDETITARGRELESRFQAVPQPGGGIVVNYYDPTGRTVPLDVDSDSGSGSGSQSGSESEDSDKDQPSSSKKKLPRPQEPPRHRSPPIPSRLVKMPRYKKYLLFVRCYSCIVNCALLFVSRFSFFVVLYECRHPLLIRSPKRRPNRRPQA